MKPMTLILISVYVAITASLSFTNAEVDSKAHVPAAWTTAGTEYLIHVRQYSMGWALGISDPQQRQEAQVPKVQLEFDIRITVLESHGEGDERIARIQFTPLNDAPDFVRGSTCVLELDAGTGTAKAIIESGDDKRGVVVATGGIQRALENAMSGFPIEWIVSASDLALVPPWQEDRSVINKPGDSFIKKLSPTLIGENGQSAVEVEAATTWPDAEPYRKVVQTWVPGEGWWRSYKRYIHGHIALDATLVERKGDGGR